MHDTSWVHPEQIPAKLSDFVGHWRQCTTRVLLEVYEDGYKILGPRLELGEPPTERTTDDICQWILSTAMDHLERCQADGLPVPGKLAARLDVVQGNDSRPRRSNLRVVTRPDGTIALSDDLGQPISGEGGPHEALIETMRILQESQTQSSQIAINCLREVHTAAKNVVQLSAEIANIMQGTAAILKEGGAARAEVYRAETDRMREEAKYQKEREDSQWDHEATMENKRIAAEILGKVSDELLPGLREFIQSRANVNPSANEHEVTVERIHTFIESNRKNWPQLEDMLGTNAMSILDAMSKTEDEDMIRAHIEKLKEEVDFTSLDVGKLAGIIGGDGLNEISMILTKF